MTIQFLDGGGGYTALKEFKDGRVAVIFILSPDCVRVRAVLKGGGHQDWCYESERDAIAALREWDGEGEPTGWARRIPMAKTEQGPK